MDITGKIIEIFETQNIKDTFRKREFVLEFAENPQYPEFIKFEFIQDKCDILDDYTAGQEVNVAFNLKGRKWTDPKGEVKYFNTLQAWRLQPVNNQDVGSTTTDAPQADIEEPGWLTDDNDDNEKLPF